MTTNYSPRTAVRSPMRGMLKSPHMSRNQLGPSRIFVSTPDNSTDCVSLLDESDSYKEDTSPKNMISPPPPYLPKWSYTVLTDDDAQDALLRHVSKKCCYKASAAREMKIKNLKPESAYKYCLESFKETRDIIPKQEPYKGNSNSTQTHGVEPNRWDIEVAHREPFCEGQQLIELPNSSKVESCTSCHGQGRHCCQQCNGKPKIPCVTCRRTGQIDDRRRCTFCHGHGNRTCTHCNGLGFTTCYVCKGFCKIRSYKIVKVNWSIHRSEHVSNPTDLPEKKFEIINGLEVLCQQDRELDPVTSIPDGKINQISLNSLQRHAEELKGAVVHMQRQSVQTIPVTAVDVEYKSQRAFTFWIYGQQERVYCPKYPKRFAGCTIS